MTCKVVCLFLWINHFREIRALLCDECELQYGRQIFIFVIFRDFVEQKEGVCLPPKDFQ